MTGRRRHGNICDGREVQVAVTKGYMRLGSETSGLRPVTGGLEAFALMMCEGIVTPGLLGFPCHRRRRLPLFSWAVVCGLAGAGCRSSCHLYSARFFVLRSFRMHEQRISIQIFSRWPTPTTLANTQRNQQHSSTSCHWRQWPPPTLPRTTSNNV